MSTPEILAEIKRRVMAVEPKAQVILYGSYARGEQGPESDIDVLILLDQEKISYEVRKSITYPLYGIELEQGILISPVVRSRSDWYGRHRVTPIFREIQRDGRSL